MYCCPCCEYSPLEDDVGYDSDYSYRSDWSIESPSEDLCCPCCPANNSSNGHTHNSGKFGLAYVVQSPKYQNVQPTGWQLEFNDSPSQVEQSCKQMLKWVNSPPLGNNATTPVKRRNGSPLNNRSRYRSPTRQRNQQRNSSPTRRRGCSPCTKRTMSPTRLKRQGSPDRLSPQKCQPVLLCCMNENINPALAPNLSTQPQCCCCNQNNNIPPTPQAQSMLPQQVPPNQQQICCCCCNNNGGEGIGTKTTCKMCTKPISEQANAIRNNTACCPCLNSNDNTRNRLYINQQQQQCKCCQPNEQGIIGNNAECKNPCCPKEPTKQEDACKCLAKDDKLCCNCLETVFDKMRDKFCVCQVCGNVYTKDSCCKRCSSFTGNDSDSEYDYIPKRDTDKRKQYVKGCKCCDTKSPRRSTDDRGYRNDSKEFSRKKSSDDKYGDTRRSRRRMDDRYNEKRYSRNINNDRRKDGRYNSRDDIERDRRYMSSDLHDDIRRDRRYNSADLSDDLQRDRRYGRDSKCDDDYRDEIRRSRNSRIERERNRQTQTNKFEKPVKESSNSKSKNMSATKKKLSSDEKSGDKLPSPQGSELVEVFNEDNEGNDNAEKPSETSTVQAE